MRYDTMYDEDELVGENEYLLPQEAMNLLAIGRSSFYKLVNSGQLPAKRIGKQWRVSRSGIADFFKSK